VTQVISKLRDSRAIRSNARSSIEIDRPRLEAAACECYQLMRRRIDRIVLPAEIAPPGHGRPAGDSSGQASLFAEADQIHRPTGRHGKVAPRARDH